MNNPALFAYASAIFCSVVAVAVVWNERLSIVHFAFLAGMSLLALDSIFSGLSWSTTSISEMVDWQHWKLWAVALHPCVWLLFSLSYGRGNYWEFVNRWKFILLAAFIIPVGLVLSDDQELIISGTQMPTGAWLLDLGSTGFYFILLLLISLVLVGINLEKTYRASVGVMRWRIKFMILGLGIVFAVRFCTSSQILLSHHIDSRLQMVDVAVLFVGCLLMLRSLFRVGRFALDIYPSHAALQSSLTVLLAGIYLVSIGVFAKVVSLFNFGDDILVKSFLFLAAAVLFIMLLLSDRVRLYIGRFVSRHFQRPLYDYRTVWRKFTDATGSCVGKEELCWAAVKSASDIFQSLSVTIWLVDDKKEKLIFAASTFLSETKAESLQPVNKAVTELVCFFQIHHEPVDIDCTKESWATFLKQCHPDEFLKGGNRICVPMIASDEVLGFMILGDRVGGTAFTWQDFELLKCIGDQIAAGLLNARLSRKLLQTKELEAFQTMSAFFVHDLKNTANTLNLMLQNLPIHFDDPAFRADALRGVSKTVTHINHLISRLGFIRQALQIKPVAADLNEIVTNALAGWEENAGIKLTKDLHSLPKAFCDPEQISKVAINLIFNAREAVAKEGQVHLQTAQINSWVVLTVTDTGCGMSQEFLSRSLFRPFQTTKKNGLGIGMFQSKMIAEAHKGRLEVESEPGRGTTFRLFLPIYTQS